MANDVCLTRRQAFASFARVCGLIVFSGRSIRDGTWLSLDLKVVDCAVDQVAAGLRRWQRSLAHTKLVVHRFLTAVIKTQAAVRGYLDRKKQRLKSAFQMWVENEQKMTPNVDDPSAEWADEKLKMDALLLVHAHRIQLWVTGEDRNQAVMDGLDIAELSAAAAIVKQRKTLSKAWGFGKVNSEIEMLEASCSTIAAVKIPDMQKQRRDSHHWSGVENRTRLSSSLSLLPGSFVHIPSVALGATIVCSFIARRLNVRYSCGLLARTDSRLRKVLSLETITRLAPPATLTSAGPGASLQKPVKTKVPVRRNQQNDQYPVAERPTSADGLLFVSPKVLSLPSGCPTASTPQDALPTSVRCSKVSSPTAPLRGTSAGSNRQQQADTCVRTLENVTFTNVHRAKIHCIPRKSTAPLNTKPLVLDPCSWGMSPYVPKSHRSSVRAANRAWRRSDRCRPDAENVANPGFAADAAVNVLDDRGNKDKEVWRWLGRATRKPGATQPGHVVWPACRPPTKQAVKSLRASGSPNEPNPPSGLGDWSDELSTRVSASRTRVRAVTGRPKRPDSVAWCSENASSTLQHVFATHDKMRLLLKQHPACPRPHTAGFSCVGLKASPPAPMLHRDNSATPQLAECVGASLFMCRTKKLHFVKPSTGADYYSVVYAPS
ncbi:hypothetical protein DIPPA_51885 [Diplonema papillatum]|nr:hypothetical protein DIPPA_51885 [Diplonema papillatum]